MLLMNYNTTLHTYILSYLIYISQHLLPVIFRFCTLLVARAMLPSLLVLERVLLYNSVIELHPEFASLNVQEKFVYLLRYENREVAKYLEKSVQQT